MIWIGYLHCRGPIKKSSMSFESNQANPLMGGAAKANGGGGPGGKRDNQGGTNFPAFDPTSKGFKKRF